jgi:hypothetical protein
VVVVVIALCWHWPRSTHDPPHEQLLVGLGVGCVICCRTWWWWSFPCVGVGVVPPTIHPTSSCSWGWWRVVCRSLAYVGVGLVPPTIHPTSSCSWGWRWVVCRSLPYVGVGIHWFVGLHWRWRHSTRDPPHEQLLMGLVVGGVSGWCGLSRTGFCR